ncbi:MAG: M56 family metallopeptidase, partial [Planctomycetales bacterium]|nr:M56 family metallopeptidase [Planctomycetales bacterium]
MNASLAPLGERIDAWADVWAAAVWRASWQGAIAVALAWFVCVTWRRLSPGWQCWLWRLAMLKFAVALLWAAPVDVPLLAPPPRANVEFTSEPIALAPIAVPTFDESQVPLLEPIDVAPTAAPALAWRPRLVVIALGAWCVGAAIGVVRLLRHWWAAQRLRVGAGLVEDAELLGILDEQRARAGLRRGPALLASPTSAGPALVGMLRPAIIVPAVMLETFAPDSLRLLVRHELAHLRRRDLDWNLLLALIGAAFFFHPLVWLATRRHRQSQESACDALVLAGGDAEPARYGQLLVDVAAGLATSRPNPAVTGVVGSAKALRRRLAALPRFSPPHVRPPRLRTTIAIALMLSVTAIAGLVPWRLVAREPEDVVAEILANWERRANVESYVYDVSSELVVDHGTSDDPRLMSPNTTDSSKMTFSRAREKLALKASGETRRDGAEAQEEWQGTWVFDGKENKSLGWRTRTSDSSTDHPDGSIDRSGTPSRTITLHRDFIPIRFARFPIEALQLRQCDLSHIKLEHESVEHNGCECAELLVPPLDPGSKRFVRVFVDRARDDVPVDVLIEVDGRVTVEYSLSYQRHPRAGWAISGWSWKSLIIPKGDVPGLLSNARYVLRDGVAQSTGKVDLVSFNQPMDDSVFELTFPTGTKVTERAEDRFARSYVAQDNGNLDRTEQWSIEPLQDTSDSFTIYYPFNEEESSRKFSDVRDGATSIDRAQNGKSADTLEASNSATIVRGNSLLTEPGEPILEVTELGERDAASDTKWTTLRGRFVYDGDPPELRSLEVTKGIEYLSDKNLVDESLLVGDDG